MTTFAWTDPVQNIDGSAIAAGEITGYQLGIRSVTSTGSVAGTYPILAPPVPADAVTETLAATSLMLAVDSYAAAVRALTTATTSAWSNEGTFAVAAPVPPTPNAPTGFTAA